MPVGIPYELLIIGGNGDEKPEQDSTTFRFWADNLALATQHASRLADDMAEGWCPQTCELQHPTVYAFRRVGTTHWRKL